MASPLMFLRLFAILQKYDFSSKSQLVAARGGDLISCLRYCKSTIFQANHNSSVKDIVKFLLFAILQKYDFSSKSQRNYVRLFRLISCLRYCKSTIFQANHNPLNYVNNKGEVVCDTAKVRFFKQITTLLSLRFHLKKLFAILQKYDFSSKSQRSVEKRNSKSGCLRYCKSTIFQANHN